MTTPASTPGILFALATATLWAISPMFMASVGRRIGSFHTNLLRILLSASALCLIILPIHLLIRGGLPLPTRAQIFWLVLSGLTGMVIGDAFFYEALVRIGPRRAIKLNTLAPVVALSVGWFFLHERVGPVALSGVFLVIAAIGYATFKSPAPVVVDEDDETPIRREPGIMTPAGLLIGIASAACIAMGSVLGRKAYEVSPDSPLDPILATTIRVGASAVLLWMWPILSGQSRRVLGHLSDGPIRKRLLIGSALGPLAGMLFYVSALKHCPAGLVSTLVALSPLIIIPVTARRYRTRIHPGIYLAAIIAVIGVALISWR